MKIKELMSKTLIIARPEDSIPSIAIQMRDSCIGCLPICQGEQIVGIITDRDLVLRGLTQGEDINSLTVSQIMSTPVITVSSDTSIQEACQFMCQHQIRRLPVLEQGTLVGILSLGDLALHPCYKELAQVTLSSISKPGGNM